MSSRNKHLMSLIKNVRKGAQRVLDKSSFLKVYGHMGDYSYVLLLTETLPVHSKRIQRSKNRFRYKLFRNTSAVQNKMFVALGLQTKYEEEDAFSNVY